jgi:hypothetical protein
MRRAALQRQGQTTRMYSEDIGFCCPALTDPRRLGLRNPRRRVCVRREAIGFLDKFAQACDPDFVDVPFLEYLTYCFVHQAQKDVQVDCRL